MEASALQAPARLTGISFSAPLLRLRSDDQLVALFRAGSDEAFRVIHDRYHQRLFAYMRQMLAGSRQDAEDALQDVFLRAHGALRASERPITLRAWLYRVAHNRCIDELRRPAPLPLEGIELARSNMPDPLAEAERREDLRRLVADVRRLPAQQRSVLLMRELEGASYADLADAHSISVSAVKSLLVRARIGLVSAAEARDVACVEIRSDLASAHDRGVRSTGRARRHLRDCGSCREYRSALRTTRRELAGLAPTGGPLSALAKLLGIGAGSGGAAAGSSAAVGGAAASGGMVAGGSATAAAVCKVAAVVCSTVVVAGGAGEVKAGLKDLSAGLGQTGTSATALAAEARPAGTSAAAGPAVVSPRERAAAADQPSVSSTGAKPAGAVKTVAVTQVAPPALVAPSEDTSPTDIVTGPSTEPPATVVEAPAAPATTPTTDTVTSEDPAAQDPAAQDPATLDPTAQDPGTGAQPGSGATDPGAQPDPHGAGKTPASTSGDQPGAKAPSGSETSTTPSATGSG